MAQDTRPGSQIGSTNSRPSGSARLNLDRWLPLIVVVALFGVWEWAAQTGQVSALFFPAPSLTLRKLITGLSDGTLLAHLQTTLLRVMLGFMLGALPGVVIGILICGSRRLYLTIDPIIAAVHPLPKISVLPLIILLVGVNENSRLIVIGLSVFFPMLINSVAGIRQIDPAHYEIARTYNAGRWAVVRRVTLPASLPFILAGARLGLNTALTITLAVELVFATSGLGTVVWGAWQTMRTESLYAALTLTALLGIAINWLLNRLSDWLIPWHREREKDANLA